MITLNLGEQHATVSTVGAGLRDYRVGARNHLRTNARQRAMAKTR